MTSAIEILVLQDNQAFIEMTTIDAGGRPAITQGQMSCAILAALTGREQLREGQIVVLPGVELAAA